MRIHDRGVTRSEASSCPEWTRRHGNQALFGPYSLALALKGTLPLWASPLEDVQPITGHNGARPGRQRGLSLASANQRTRQRHAEPIKSSDTYLQIFPRAPGRSRDPGWWGGGWGLTFTHAHTHTHIRASTAYLVPVKHTHRFGRRGRPCRLWTATGVRYCAVRIQKSVDGIQT